MLIESITNLISIGAAWPFQKSAAMGNKDLACWNLKSIDRTPVKYSYMPNLTALASIDNHRFIHQQSVAIVGRCNGFLQILRCRIHTQLEASLSQKKKKSCFKNKTKHKKVEE